MHGCAIRSHTKGVGPRASSRLNNQSVRSVPHRQPTTTPNRRRPPPSHNTHAHLRLQAGRLQYARAWPAPPRSTYKMARLAAISGTLLAVLVASPQASGFVPAPPALAGANGLWGAAAAAAAPAASTAASTPVPAGFFGPAMQGGRRRGATTMMTPPAAASAGQATKVRAVLACVLGMDGRRPGPGAGGRWCSDSPRRLCMILC